MSQFNYRNFRRAKGIIVYLIWQFGISVSLSMLLIILCIGSYYLKNVKEKEDIEHKSEMKEIKDTLSDIRGNTVGKTLETNNEKSSLFNKDLAGNSFRNMKIRLADFANQSNRSLILDGKTFDDCIIYGPAVIKIVNNNEIVYSHFGAPGSNPDNLWIIVQEQRWVTGIIGIKNTKFRHCTFVDIAFIGTREEREIFTKGITMSY